MNKKDWKPGQDSTATPGGHLDILNSYLEPESRKAVRIPGHELRYDSDGDERPHMI